MRVDLKAHLPIPPSYRIDRGRLLDTSSAGMLFPDRVAAPSFSAQQIAPNCSLVATLNSATSAPHSGILLAQSVQLVGDDAVRVSFPGDRESVTVGIDELSKTVGQGLSGSLAARAFELGVGTTKHIPGERTKLGFPVENLYLGASLQPKDLLNLLFDYGNITSEHIVETCQRFPEEVMPLLTGNLVKEVRLRGLSKADLADLGRNLQSTIAIVEKRPSRLTSAINLTTTDGSTVEWASPRLVLIGLDKTRKTLTFKPPGTEDTQAITLSFSEFHRKFFAQGTVQTIGGDEVSLYASHYYSLLDFSTEDNSATLLNTHRGSTPITISLGSLLEKFSSIHYSPILQAA